VHGEEPLGSGLEGLQEWFPLGEGGQEPAFVTRPRLVALVFADLGVVLGVDDEPSLALGQAVPGYQFPRGVVHPQLRWAYPHAHTPADETGRNGIEITQHGDRRVPGDGPLLDPAGEEFLLGQGPEEGFLHQPAIIGSLTGGSVDPEVARPQLLVHEPVEDIAVHVLQESKPVPAGQEAPLEVIERSLHLAFRRRLLDEPDLETVVLGELGEAFVDQGLVADRGTGDGRHVVVDPYGHHPLEEGKGRHVGVEEGVLSFIQERLQVLVPAPGEDHREEVDPAEDVGQSHRMLGPVDLGLQAGIRFVPHVSPPLPLGPDRAHKLSHRGPASPVPLLAKSEEDHHLRKTLLDKLLHPVPVGIQDPWLRGVGSGLLAGEDRPNGLPGQLEVSGDPP